MCRSGAATLPSSELRHGEARKTGQRQFSVLLQARDASGVPVHGEVEACYVLDMLPYGERRVCHAIGKVELLFGKAPFMGHSP